MLGGGQYVCIYTVFDSFPSFFSTISFTGRSVYVGPQEYGGKGSGMARLKRLKMSMGAITDDLLIHCPVEPRHAEHVNPSILIT